MLAHFTVDSTLDAPDANPGDGLCATLAGECTLRAAIMELNAQAAILPPLVGAYRVNLAVAGIYTLDLVGPGEDGAATGDLDINNARVWVRNTSGGEVRIDGNATDRVFDVGPLAPADLRIRLHITIQNGRVVSVPVNTATDIGGAIRVLKDSHLSLRDVTLTGNQAGARGGAIGLPPTAALSVGGTSTLDLRRVLITKNSASVEAGGFFSNVVATLKRVRVIDNEVTGTVGNERGGGIANSGRLTIINSTVSENRLAGGTGGGVGNRGDPVANVFGEIIMERVTVDHNRAPLGGGIGNNGIITLTNVTLSNNVAFAFGGGFLSGPQGTPTFNYVTVNGNTAPMGGGGILTQAPVQVQGSIISNSPAGGNCAGPIISLGDNLSSDGTCPFALLGDPLLGILKFNGGPTRTHLPQSGSPAVDAVVFNPCPPPEKDQRGFPRPRDGDGNGSAECDIGAVER